MDEMMIDYKELMDQLYDGVYFVDRTRKILYWNRAAEKFTGFPASEVLGKCCADNILRHVDKFGNGICETGCPLKEVITDGVPRDAEVFLHHKDGHRIPVSIHASPVLDVTGRIIGAVEAFTDNTPKANILARIAELEELVMLDPLTMLGNRRFVEMNLQSRLELNFNIDGIAHTAFIASESSTHYVAVDGEVFELRRPDPRRARRRQQHGDENLAASMPGQVSRVLVGEGDVVRRGQALIVLEAMKMEIKIAAPRDGRVAKVLVRQGQVVERGQALIEMTHEP